MLICCEVVFRVHTGATGAWDCAELDGASGHMHITSGLLHECAVDPKVSDGESAYVNLMYDQPQEKWVQLEGHRGGSMGHLRLALCFIPEPISRQQVSIYRMLSHLLTSVARHMLWPVHELYFTCIFCFPTRQ